jgi:glutaredoxin
MLLVGCHQSLRLSEAQMDAYHLECQARIKGGYTVSRRPNDIGMTEKKPTGTPVIVYGAGWCEACDVAEEYMARRRIPFVAFDVDRDEAARAAMTATKRAAGLPPTNVLPVIDIRGIVTAGFMPCVLEAAWNQT